MTNTPVALILFNRPEATEQVFREIARAKPRRLFLIADGPRPDRPEDAARCEAARAVVQRVDWDCDVSRDFSDVNLGVARRPATGIDRAFEQAEELIVLEDDCVPRQSFFRFCDELLERYRDDERVMQVSGNNFQLGHRRTTDSYYFSHHNICWGWASWRRAWKYYDISVKLWPTLRDTPWLREIVKHPLGVAYWSEKFERAFAAGGDVDFWDYQWTFACWAQNGLSISPSTTLVTNVGFGPDATHTRSPGNRLAYLHSEELEFPLRHPPCMYRASEADDFFVQEVVVPKRRSRPTGLRRLGKWVSSATRSVPRIARGFSG